MKIISDLFITLTRGHLVTPSLGAFCFANVCLRTHRPRNASIPRPPVRRQPLVQAFWSSPHPISNSQLRTLLHFHLCPIYLVVFKGVYSFDGITHLEGGFTLRCLQRLSRPNLATLLCSWSATGAPEVRPSRSSRTKDSSSQISCAHNG